ncbi:hypothetical protein [Gluconacetobacter takamatsuzukensis]|uniref:Lipoprotein n=1 Tax=Gluconacetobacter takamatsuzukensis TaxID=1286190 RepID=A0A7W4PP31_9PROT|nr:hypothetical protein [Gluconacetobacter takamatsuzukensis]MBB2204758.1 hypothetical protein [Gluconacetobacter takamatsuzukensis]
MAIDRIARGLVLAGLVALAGCQGVAEAYPPPPGTPIAGYGYLCKAGVYSCHLPMQVPLGAACSCPGLGAPSYGNVH